MFKAKPVRYNYKFECTLCKRQWWRDEMAQSRPDGMSCRWLMCPRCRINHDDYLVVVDVPATGE